MTAGTEGASVGFANLELAELPESATGQVVLSALALQTTDRWQRVSYEATYRPARQAGDEGGAAEVFVARAIGQTAALHRGPADKAARCDVG